MMILDLHEHTIQEAYEETLDFVKECHEERIKKARVITGKGVIGREFPMWLERNPIVRKVEQTNDGGCYHIWIAIKQKNDFC